MKRVQRIYRPAVRYSESFKLEIVRELERELAPVEQVRRKYGIGQRTIQHWIAKYGNGTRGKVIRVDTPKTIDETRQLKQRIRQLESALADASVDLALEKAYTRIACKRAGIADVEEFKKKAAGNLPTKP